MLDLMLALSILCQHDIALVVAIQGYNVGRLLDCLELVEEAP